MEAKKRRHITGGEVSVPAIFRIGNYSDKSIKLFSGPLEEHQVVRPVVAGSQTYDSYIATLRAVGLIRIQFGNYKNLSVTFSRKIKDRVISKTIPIRLLLKTNQFVPDVIQIETGPLILDGDTTFEITGAEHHPVEIYFYPVKIDAGNIDADALFLDFVNDQCTRHYRVYILSVIGTTGKNAPDRL